MWLLLLERGLALEDDQNLVLFIQILQSYLIRRTGNGRRMATLVSATPRCEARIFTQSAFAPNSTAAATHRTIKMLWASAEAAPRRYRETPLQLFKTLMQATATGIRDVREVSRRPLSDKQKKKRSWRHRTGCHQIAYHLFFPAGMDYS